MVADTSSHFRYRLRRDGNAVAGWFRGMWTRRWFRWLSYAAIAGLPGLALIWVIFARDLPSVDQLRDYDPPLPTIDYRSEEHTSELQSLMRLSYAGYCLQKTHAN